MPKTGSQSSKWCFSARFSDQCSVFSGRWSVVRTEMSTKWRDHLARSLSSLRLNVEALTTAH